MQKLHFERDALFRSHIFLVSLDKAHEANAFAVVFNCLLKLLILEARVTILFLGGSFRHQVLVG